MTEKELERERVKCVFLLGGGELHEPDADFPHEWDDRYWYEGKPDYVEKDYSDNTEYRTICTEDAPYGIKGYVPAGWRVVEVHVSSGEHECWWCTNGENGDIEGKCKLCEGSGNVYLGSACEMVVKPRELEV